MPLMDGWIDDGSKEVEKLIKNMKTIIDRALGDIGKLSATKQLLLGAASGWVTGFMAKQIWKIVAIGIGTGVIALHIASQNGYINFNWDAINKRVDNFRDKLEKEATGKSPACTDKVIDFLKSNTSYSAGFTSGFFFGIAPS